VPAPRARRVVLLVAVAAALGAAGCGRTVAGSAAPATASPGGDSLAAAAAPRDAHCPAVATLRAALPRDGAGGSYTLRGPVLCSGDWAVANPLYTAADPRGDEQTVSVTQLFHRIGDGWQAVDRAPLCADGSVPSAIYELTCDSN
jgi:hypothetical protein